MAHPDDAFVWCGGFILECLKLDAKVTVVSLSKTSSTLEKKIRKTTDSNKIEYQSFKKELVNENRICDLISKNTPELIITHWASDTHDYHRKTTNLTELAIKNYKLRCYDKGCHANIRVLQCDTYYSIGQNGEPFPGKVILDISSCFKKKVSILRKTCGKYLSIIENMVRIQNAFYGGKIGVRFAEAFLESASLASIGGGLGRTTAKNIVDLCRKPRTS
jgi:LmbE family N-acetylglucosaminyl deacetylase